jgi:hypothetical protein
MIHGIDSHPANFGNPTRVENFGRWYYMQTEAMAELTPPLIETVTNQISTVAA